MLLHNPTKLPPIDRFEKLSKDAIYAAHARPLSESRQPESIQFALDLPGMRCGIVNHSPDSPALLRGEVRKRLALIPQYLKHAGRHRNTALVDGDFRSDENQAAGGAHHARFRDQDLADPAGLDEMGIELHRR